MITFNKWIWYKVIYGIFKKCCIGWMVSYTYGDYVYFSNNIDAPKEHHNQLILNQEPYFYITSLSNLMEATLTLLPKIFLIKW